MDGLPIPRLELRWTKEGKSWNKRTCTYGLVLPLREIDIRRDKGDGTFQTELFVEIGKTNVEGGQHPIEGDKVSTPFRDGAHAMWDAEVLGLQIWAVCEDRATRIYHNKE